MEWSLGIGRGEPIRNPSWEQIHAALLEMDGIHADEVMLQLSGTGNLVVGGGNDGRYIVVYFPQDRPDDYSGDSLALADASLSGEDVTLSFEVDSSFPARLAVSLPLVLQVVEHFYRTGQIPGEDQLPEGVMWEP
jgi:hypothetical protein